MQNTDCFFLVVPLTLPHMTSEDAILQDYVIPKNTIVIGNLYSCARDTGIWNNASDFKPERHLDANGQFHSNEKFIPYGIGIAFLILYPENWKCLRIISVTM